jgi:hypothetical protein
MLLFITILGPINLRLCATRLKPSAKGASSLVETAKNLCRNCLNRCCHSSAGTRELAVMSATPCMMMIQFSNS